MVGVGRFSNSKVISKVTELFLPDARHPLKDAVLTGNAENAAVLHSICTVQYRCKCVKNHKLQHKRVNAQNPSAMTGNTKT